MSDKMIAFLSKELEIPQEKINDKTKFSDLNMDSLDMIDMITAAEKFFGVEINDQVMKSTKTVGGFDSYIEQLMNKGR